MCFVLLFNLPEKFQAAPGRPSIRLTTGLSARSQDSDRSLELVETVHPALGGGMLMLDKERGSRSNFVEEKGYWHKGSGTIRQLNG